MHDPCFWRSVPQRCNEHHCGDTFVMVAAAAAAKMPTCQEAALQTRIGQHRRIAPVSGRKIHLTFLYTSVADRRSRPGAGTGRKFLAGKHNFSRKSLRGPQGSSSVETSSLATSLRAQGTVFTVAPSRSWPAASRAGSGLLLRSRGRASARRTDGVGALQTLKVATMWQVELRNCDGERKSK